MSPEELAHQIELMVRCVDATDSPGALSRWVMLSSALTRMPALRALLSERLRPSLNANISSSAWFGKRGAVQGRIYDEEPIGASKRVALDEAWVAWRAKVRLPPSSRPPLSPIKLSPIKLDYAEPMSPQALTNLLSHTPCSPCEVAHLRDRRSNKKRSKRGNVHAKENSPVRSSLADENMTFQHLLFAYSSANVSPTRLASKQARIPLSPLKISSAMQR